MWSRPATGEPAGSRPVIVVCGEEPAVPPLRQRPGASTEPVSKGGYGTPELWPFPRAGEGPHGDPAGEGRLLPRNCWRPFKTIPYAGRPACQVWQV